MYDTRMPAEHAAVPIWACEDIYWEDFEIGRQLRTIRRTITEGECQTFNAMVGDMHPYGCDQIFIEDEGLFDRPVVAGALVFSIGIGMVATNWWQAFSYGYDHLRFIRPVFYGDTIYTLRTNIHKEPKYEKRGLTKARYDIFKGEGEIVLTCEHIQTVLYRDPDSIKASGKSIA